MKRFLILLFAGIGSLVWAQTNPAPPAAKPDPTIVDSDTAQFDMGGLHSSREVVYRGNVHVSDPKIDLRCEKLTLDLPPHGHVSHIFAETNVVIDFTEDNGEKYHVTSDRAVYDYIVVNQTTNETVTWTGNPIVTTQDGNVLHSDPLIWDRRASRLYFKHDKMVLPNGLSGGGTNNSALKLY